MAIAQSFFYKLFFNKSSSYTFIRILIILAICILSFQFYSYLEVDKYYEGFEQMEKFVLKQDENKYDDFYTKIYDNIYLTNDRTKYEIRQIIQNTKPSLNDSVFLDVGSGTGHLVNTLQELGYNAFGIDKSQSMVEYANNKFPECEFKCENVNKNTVLYDRETFSHITCLNMTIYEMSKDDRKDFYKNCHFWLSNNGYLILHLVDKSKFNTIIPIGNPNFVDNPQKYSKDRIKKTEVDFVDFTYKSIYNFNDDGSVNLTEKFKDKTSSNIRENEINLYMNNLELMEKEVRDNGFIVKGVFNYDEYNADEYQYLYIFEKI